MDKVNKVLLLHQLQKAAQIGLTKSIYTCLHVNFLEKIKGNTWNIDQVFWGETWKQQEM